MHESDTLDGGICECDWKKLQEYLDSFLSYDGMVIPILQKTQEIFGYLPIPVLERIAAHIHVPGSDLLGVATFYSLFRLTPVGRNIIKVCHGTACHVGGAEQISDAVMNHLSVGENETTPNRKFTFTKVACLGCCSLAPVMMINDETFGRLTPDKTRKTLDEFPG